VQTYVVNLKDKEVVKGPWSQPNVESGASLLHALPRAFFTCQIRHVVTFLQARAVASSCSATRASRI
jgi:hypothetical protein